MLIQGTGNPTKTIGTILIKSAKDYDNNIDNYCSINLTINDTTIKSTKLNKINCYYYILSILRDEKDEWCLILLLLDSFNYLFFLYTREYKKENIIIYTGSL